MLRNANVLIRIKLAYGGEALTVFGRELIRVKILIRLGALFCECASGMVYEGLVAFGQL